MKVRERRKKERGLVLGIKRMRGKERYKGRRDGERENIL